MRFTAVFRVIRSGVEN